MENIVKKLFEAGLLSEDDQVKLQENFDARVQTAAAQAREQAVMQVREEMSQRVEHDKSTLVEAMDRMITDVVQKYESQKVTEAQKLKEAQANAEAVAGKLRKAYRTRIKEHAQVLESFVMNKLSQEIGEFNADKNAVSEQRAQFATALAESKLGYQTRLKAHTKMLESFVMNKLSQEIGEFNTDKTAVSGMRVKLATALAENKTVYKTRMKEHMTLMRSFVVQKLDEQMTALRKQESDLNEQKIVLETEASTLRTTLEEQFAKRVASVDKFVVQKVAEELREFHEDKKALVNKKVQLVSEARAQLASTQRKFVAEAAKLVDLKVTETMKVELKQLHEDLERNRQNMFGRRIFEAVAAEFMTSYFSEGTEVRKLEAILESKNVELTTAKKKLTESQSATDVASRKARLAEEAATRTKTLAELLSPLNREKRSVMEELLETVKTTQLRESFQKYLPAVLNEGGKKTAPQSRLALREAPKEKKIAVSVTGDQRNNRLLETVKAEDTEINAETAHILHLAGMKK